jgi:hypothetical protein
VKEIIKIKTSRKLCGGFIVVLLLLPVTIFTPHLIEISAFIFLTIISLLSLTKIELVLNNENLILKSFKFVRNDLNYQTRLSKDIFYSYKYLEGARDGEYYDNIIFKIIVLNDGSCFFNKPERLLFGHKTLFESFNKLIILSEYGSDR